MTKMIITKMLCSMKKLVFIFGVLFAAFCFSGCSKDEESQDAFSDYCYTGIVKYIIPETGSVQVVITEDPKIVSDRPIRGDEIVFANKELTNSDLQVGDVIEFKIIEYEMAKRIGGSADSPMHYKCKVKPCK